jgi:uncharacterized surface protein with fasciclin (FAS1) repeats
MKLLSITALGLLLGLASHSAAADAKTIAETVTESKDHTILLTAVKEAGLVGVLNGKGPMTVFAPTDAAFKKLGDDTLKKVVADKELLKKILLAHVITDKAVYAKDVIPPDGKDVNGFKITANKDGVKIGDAKVTTADLKCSNGVIHVIDTVLIPK